MNTKTIINSTILLTVILYACSDKSTEVTRSVGIIPQPSEIIQLSGIFRLDSKTKIACTDELKPIALLLANYLRPATGFDLEIIEPSRLKKVISISLDGNLSGYGNEGYRLEVNSDRISIAANSESGIFYGIQTLRQLLPVQIENKNIYGENYSWEVPCVLITDSPRFKWRGLMLDCSRTFLSKEYIERTIRLMALYKMNVLQLHLTDDQGWRLEIKKYPELTEKGSRFPEKWNEPEEYEGFYTQDDIREIVSYAAQHNISVVPEIEMPGHTLAVLACYPGLSCTNGPFEIHPYFKGPGIHEDIFCAGNEKTFEFLENVLTEVFELFPSEYIHIGGDEAPKKRWVACKKCQNRINVEGLKDEHELQSWFIKRVEEFVNNKGKKLIGWDEIMEGGLSETATVMYWRGWINDDVPQKVVNQGNDVIMSPTTHCYFDYKYEEISTLKAYEFEPVPNGITQEQTKHVLGVQANFWSHIDRTEAAVDKQLFPRLLSIAEVAWSPKEKRDSLYFKNKVKSHLERLAELGVKYYPDSTIISDIKQLK